MARVLDSHSPKRTANGLQYGKRVVSSLSGIQQKLQRGEWVHQLYTRRTQEVTEDVISGYAKRAESGKERYGVTHITPDIFPLFKYAQSAETRRRGHESYEARLELIARLLDRTLELRRDIATLLGYKTWADHVTEVKMVKSGDNIKKFLTDLEQRLPR